MAGSAGQKRPAASPRTDGHDRTSGAGARAAADRAVWRNSVTVDVLGRRLELPAVDQLAFLAGLGILAALEIVEWPVVVAIAVGHGLAHSRRARVLREFGEALEEA